jgi:hypothetical protein
LNRAEPHVETRVVEARHLEIDLAVVETLQDAPLAHIHGRIAVKILRVRGIHRRSSSVRQAFATMWAIVMNWVIAALVVAVVVVWIIAQLRIWRSRAVR